MNSPVHSTGVQIYPHLVAISQEEWTCHVNTRSFEYNSIPHLRLRQSWLTCDDVPCVMSSAYDTIPGCSSDLLKSRTSLARGSRALVPQRGITSRVCSTRASLLWDDGRATLRVSQNLLRQLSL